MFGNDLGTEKKLESCLTHLFSAVVQSRCNARATIWWNPVCMQRGGLTCQSPALLQLQLCLDRPTAWYRLRQLPVSTSTHICKRT